MSDFAYSTIPGLTPAGGVTLADLVWINQGGADLQATMAQLAATILASQGIVVTTGTAPPTSGAWVQGSHMWNTLPAAGGTPGWVCVASGTPGTWKAMANLAP